MSLISHSKLRAIFRPEFLLVYIRFLPTGFAQVYASLYLGAMLARGRLTVGQKRTFYPFLAILIVVLLQILSNHNYLRHWVNFQSSLFCYFIGAASVVRNVRRFYSFGLTFFVVDFVVRAALSPGGRGVLELKENSIFYMDSNFVAINLVLFYLALIGFKKSNGDKVRLWSWESLIFTLLSIGTLSKIAIAVVLAVNISKGRLRIFIPLVAFFSGLGTLVALAVFYQQMWGTYFLRGQALNHSLFDFNMFGYGINSTIDRFGEYGHSGLAVFMSDLGLVGVLAFSVFFICFASLSRFNLFFVLFYLLMFLSLFSYSSHFTFWLFGYFSQKRVARKLAISTA